MIPRTNQKIRSLSRLDLFVIFSFAIGIFLFLYFTGTLNSGYHFIDDHVVLSIKNELSRNSYWQTVFNYTRGDLAIRFRPLFHPYLVTTTYFFGADFIKTSLFTAFLFFLSSVFLYTGLKEILKSRLWSIVFVLMALVGPQAAIWWRLGVNETIGVLFLSLSFYFMASCLQKERYNLNNYLFIFFLSVASLCKESFILVIPAMVSLKIWNEHRVLKSTLWESAKKNKIALVPFFLMFLELAIIKFVVGTNKIGYAGLTENSMEFIRGVKEIILNKMSLLYWSIMIAGLLLVYTISIITVKIKKKENIFSIIMPVIGPIFFALLLVLPQIFMHAKSGMVERYLLPTTIGLSFLATILVKESRTLIMRAFGIVIIVSFLLFSFGEAREYALWFSTIGEDANTLLDLTTENTNPQSNILLVADPVTRFEVSYSIKTYLSYYGYSRLYAYPEYFQTPASDFEISLDNQWQNWFRGRGIRDMNSMPNIIIVFDASQAEIFFSKKILSYSEYVLISMPESGHAVYRRIK